DTAESNRNQAIIKALGKELEAEFPRSLIEQESRRIVSQLLNELKQGGQDISGLMKDEVLQGLLQQMAPQAIESLQQTLAIQELARLESLEVSDTELDEEVHKILSNMQDPGKINQDNLRDMVQLDLQQRKVLEWFTEHNTIEWITAEQAEAEEAAAKAEEIAAAIEAQKAEAEAGQPDTED
ncbi:MAG: hypothetical protein ACO4AI_05925, partial [Prochlorothrix sp.]